MVLSCVPLCVSYVVLLCLPFGVLFVLLVVGLALSLCRSFAGLLCASFASSFACSVPSLPPLCLPVPLLHLCLASVSLLLRVCPSCASPVSVLRLGVALPWLRCCLSFVPPLCMLCPPFASSVLRFCVAFVLVLFWAQPHSSDLSRETNRQQCRHLIGLGLL